MGSLFKSDTKVPDPEPPATMPDPEDELAKRAKRRQTGGLQTTSSSAQNRLAPVPGTIGREYSRSTLGAN
ncbi:hypothetical protein RWE87_04950 [Sinorhizobium meliloti]|uniref:hypothetical protein n=1 Tax=Rhizobium meliloti TaxID=382 RepID=UPI00299EEB5C|nr:hypothetical protein [Sinorhizobium meliloti]